MHTGNIERGILIDSEFWFQNKRWLQVQVLLTGRHFYGTQNELQNELCKSDLMKDDGGKQEGKKDHS